MGETTTQPGAPAEFPRQDAAAITPPASVHNSSQHTAESPSAYPGSHPPHHEQGAGAQPAFVSQVDMTHQQRPNPFDFGAMTHALPNGQYRPQPYSQGPQRYPPATTQMPAAQYAAAHTLGAMPGQQYYYPHHSHMAPFYQAPLASQPPTTMAPRHDMGYYPTQLLMGQPHHSGTHFCYPSGAAFPGHPTHPPASVGMGQYGLPNPHQHQDYRPAQPQSVLQDPISTLSGPQTNGITAAHSNIVRGPPRKPRQSGHAIWIGNLPPQTDLMSLVHHVCRVTEGLESLFLISKSNCAFANFKDEQACSAAQRKLHDSKFSTVRLVSRLRKSTVEGPAGVTAPTGPAASAPQAGGNAQEASASGGDGEDVKENGAAAARAPTAAVPEAVGATPLLDGGSSQKDRFFVLKSLTVEDLELSVRTNIWATQSHNEEALNSAFKTSDNVYLVFSANKSGEYFGYARMMSAINEDPAAAIEFAPSAQSASEVDLPKAIPTEATEFAPKGRIIDDSARGTIFWEADHEDKLGGSDGVQDDEASGGSVGGDTGSVRSGGQDGSMSEPKAWGKPFRLEWLSTARLPFYRTRGLRNPWNSNREVKIARDGTELEPSVGRRLIGLFNRAQPPAGMLPPMVPPVVPVGTRMPVPIPVGYPPMR